MLSHPQQNEPPLQQKPGELSIAVHLGVRSNTDNALDEKVIESLDAIKHDNTIKKLVPTRPADVR